jgi:hypothetical protein
VSGSFDVDATATTTPDVYQIHGLGRSSGANPTTKSASAQIKVIRATPTFAGGAGGALTVGLGNYFNGGSLITSGLLTNNGILNGGSRTSFNVGRPHPPHCTHRFVPAIA